VPSGLSSEACPSPKLITLSGVTSQRNPSSRILLSSFSRSVCRMKLCGMELPSEQPARMPGRGTLKGAP
jgi:hypothetical protein